MCRRLRYMRILWQRRDSATGAAHGDGDGMQTFCLALKVARGAVATLPRIKSRQSV